MSGIIRLLPNTRTVLNVNDADLIEVQIMDGGANDKESAHMSIGELKKAVNNGANPLVYKALISQNAPITTRNSISVLRGQILTLVTYGIADKSKIDDLELISGIIYVVGSKYRSSIDASIGFSIATTMLYDGAPYVVSTDASGNFNPFVNTTGVTETYSYSGVGDGLLTMTGLFSNESKISYKIGKAQDVTKETFMYYNNSNSLGIGFSSYDGIPTNNILDFTLIEIEIYP